MFFSCQGKATESDDSDSKTTSQTPVTVTTINDSTLVDYIDLNATSTTLQKNYVKSNANGYVQQVNTQLGQNVSREQVLFIIKTKEAQTIGNSINALDTTFKFTGVNKIKAPSAGYISAFKPSNRRLRSGRGSLSGNKRPGQLCFFNAVAL